MTDTKLYAARRIVSCYELDARAADARLPSRLLREYEAGLIVELARQTALEGRRFVGWPTITLDSSANPEHGYYGFGITLRAEVNTVKH